MRSTWSPVVWMCALLLWGVLQDANGNPLGDDSGMKMQHFLKLCVLLSLACDLQALTITVSVSVVFFHIDEAACNDGSCVGVSKATCQVSSDPPHFKTFDGKTFDFQGSGNYTLFKTSDNDINLPGFSIKMINQNRGGDKNMNPSLEITDPSQKIVIQPNDKMLTEVNNKHLKKEVSISSSGFYIKITTDFSLFLHWDKKTSIKITLPTNFNQKVGGMCGNYNGNSADDFETPFGTLAAGPAEFGKSWAVDE